MKFAFLFITVILSGFTSCQTTDTTKNRYFKLSGFVDIYYQYDFDEPANNERPGYIYNHKRHNKPAVNVALIKTSFQKNKWRANLGLMTGDYAKYNLAAEPDWAQFIYEANIGYAFTDKFSLKVGVIPSHIGFESAISKDNYTLSRSLLAENSPYYETGLKFNYTLNKKWTIALLGLNGWQHIKDNNTSLAFGTQVQFNPNDKWLFNSSTFLGNEKPDSISKQLRFFHNFYTSYAVTKKINMALFFDYGIEEKLSSVSNNKWLGFVWQLQWKASDKISSSFLYEYFTDKTGVIVTPVLVNGFRLSGFSTNLDWTIIKNLLWRNELRLFRSPDKIFSKDNTNKNNNTCFLSSLAFWFN